MPKDLRELLTVIYGVCRALFPAPRGHNIPASVFGLGDGTFRVEYTPAEVGQYWEYNSGLSLH